jgi:hypothetical protein
VGKKKESNRKIERPCQQQQDKFFVQGSANETGCLFHKPQAAGHL